MTENAPNQDQARGEALRHVIERVNSWQETATDGTIADELDRGLREAGITLTDAERYDLVQRISEGADIDVKQFDPPSGGPA